MDSYPHLDLKTCSFIDFRKCCEDLFKAERDYTVERIKLYNTIFMQDNDSFSSIYARLSAQTALCNWPLDQERETLKDLFISRIRDVEVQRQLIRVKANLDDTLQLALENENGLRPQNNFRNYSRITTLLLTIPTLLESSRNRLRQYNNSRIKETAVEEEVSTVLINVKVKINRATFAVTRFPSNTAGRVRPEKLLAMLVKRGAILLRCVTLRGDVLTWFNMRRYLPIKSAT